MLPRPIAVDANLLVLLIVGLASETYIPQHKRLRAFTVADFQLLRGLLGSASSIVVSPNVLTETSNLIRQITEPARARITAVFRHFVISATETYVPSARSIEDPTFPRLGLTDSVLLSPEFAELLIVTVDLDLYLEASRRGHDVINFNHHIEASRV